MVRLKSVGIGVLALPKKSIVTVVAVAAALTFWSVAASAQVIVVQSTAKSVKAGSLLAKDAKVSIPKGARAVFVLPSGATRTVDGPFNGRASELTRGVKSNPSIFEQVKKYVRTGGSDQKSVGATRSFSAARPVRHRSFSWNEVPLTATGDHCIEKGAKVSLVRSRSTKAATVTIIDRKTNLRAQVPFAVGNNSAPWPENISIDASASYVLLAAGQPMREIRLRSIAPLPPREDTLQVLHHQRCNNQFRSWIRHIQTASN